ncbi:MAG TPA: hypothetical protein VJ914_36255 [Pseudonocardiaceae bacterium]|nr:hypothetical protein [Pseudonocardiaceae bacterium]
MSIRLLVSNSVAIAAIRAALCGNTPRQPMIVPLIPTNSIGRNIISIATRLVT